MENLKVYSLITFKKLLRYNSHVCTWYKLAKGMAVKSAILHTIPEGHGYHFGPDKKNLIDVLINYNKSQKIECFYVKFIQGK
jgi:hypothetical protein